jgi:hypothetical protein
MNKENKKPHNPSAFPAVEQHGDLQTWSTYEGMTLRDYFAAKAMQALLTHESVLKLGIDEANLYVSGRGYQVADAMLKRRENVETPV